MGWSCETRNVFSPAFGTLTYVEVPKNQAEKALLVKWVNKIILNEEGEVERLKARLVFKDFNQIYGIDYTEVYAPVSKHTTLSCLLLQVVDRRMHVHQMDVSTLFSLVISEELCVRNNPNVFM